MNAANDTLRFRDERLDRRFWPKVDRAAECWVWTAYVSKAGYGVINDGTPKYAHRLVYELLHGPIPDGMFVCHRCDNRRCVNPSRLFIGTAANKSRDMVSKGRSTKGRDQPPGSRKTGESHGRARLTAVQVAEIRRLYQTGSFSQQQLGRMFGVSGAHVCGIVHGKFWREEAVSALP
jgi:hypothetical protein